MKYVIRFLMALFVIPAAVGYWHMPYVNPWIYWPVAVILLLAANVLPFITASRVGKRRKYICGRLRVCYHGVECLWAFAVSTAAAVAVHLWQLPLLWNGEWKRWVVGGVICFVTEAVVFWNGMISVYIASVQLGIRRRAIGLLCGLIPIVNLILMFYIMYTVGKEVNFETFCLERDEVRKEERICATRYPILMVHGLFFRDSQVRVLNYWGRIPASLRKNGAKIYFGRQQSATSVAKSAEELAIRIRAIVEQTGCEKVNIIAHSKGGLDIRYAVAHLGVASMVASVTTVCTPHRGCAYVDYLLGKMPEKAKNGIIQAYNRTMYQFGDEEPDFLAAVTDLTASRCAVMDEELTVPADANIYCQSVGSTISRTAAGRFPTNVFFPLVRRFDGPNDGLVAETAFAWGEKYTLLETPPSGRGISHADMIDLNRENIPDFDVREFYVQLVSDLRERGL